MEGRHLNRKELGHSVASKSTSIATALLALDVEWCCMWGDGLEALLTYHCFLWLEDHSW